MTAFIEKSERKEIDKRPGLMLKALRLDWQHDKDDTAAALGVTKDELDRLESGKDIMTPAHILAAARHYRILEGAFFNEINPQSDPADRGAVLDVLRCEYDWLQEYRKLETENERMRFLDIVDALTKFLKGK